jgi:hypothetical protein
MLWVENNVHEKAKSDIANVKKAVKDLNMRLS